MVEVDVLNRYRPLRLVTCVYGDEVFREWAPHPQLPLAILVLLAHLPLKNKVLLVFGEQLQKL